jgi:hypothetical protein
LIEMHEMRGFHLHVAYMMHMIVAATRGLAAETGDLDSSQSGSRAKSMNSLVFAVGCRDCRVFLAEN